MKKRKQKIKLKGLIITLFIVLFGVLLFFLYRNLKVTNIYVTGNNILKEQEIIEEAKLENYPYLYTVSKDKIKSNLKKNALINDVKISKSLLGKITIDISENKVLYHDLSNKYMLSNGKLVDLDIDILGVPTLINQCNDMCDKLVQKLVLVDNDILKRVSEIEYKPNDLDKERFMFYMNDTNYVYVTLSKLNLINSYNEIYPTLEGKKGILYLDSGNHFEIKKS